MKLSTFRIAVVQTKPDFGEVRSNVRSALSQADRSLHAAGGCDLVILPELFNTGYLFENRAQAVSLSESATRGETARELREFAGDHRTHIVAGICERKRDGVYNSALCIGPGGVIGTYQKVHLFDREKLFFDPGQRPWPVFKLGSARVGVMICFDWRFPEAARTLALQGADVIAHPSNLVMPYCQEAMRTRALENLVYCATANRIGTDKSSVARLRFTGRSQIVNPHGEILARLGAGRVGVAIATVDLRLSRRKRVTPRNDLFADRVPALYRAVTAKTAPKSR